MKYYPERILNLQGPISPFIETDFSWEQIIPFRMRWMWTWWLNSALYAWKMRRNSLCSAVVFPSKLIHIRSKKEKIWINTKKPVLYNWLGCMANGGKTTPPSCVHLAQTIGGFELLTEASGEDSIQKRISATVTKHNRTNPMQLRSIACGWRQSRCRAVRINIFAPGIRIYDRSWSHLWPPGSITLAPQEKNMEQFSAG